MTKKTLSTKTNNPSINAFLEKIATTKSIKPAAKRGRLLFAMDATASRESTWDSACQLQSEMFTASDALGGLDVQLCYFRGYNEFDHTSWLADTETLRKNMTAVSCLGGHTQIERVLKHAIAETKRSRINAIVFVGDNCEENVEDICNTSGQLGVLGVPIFVFQEGSHPHASQVFHHMATLSQGAYCHFDSGSAQQLRDLMSAVAVYAAGGRKALESYSQKQGGNVLQLSRQLTKEYID
ncbi:MAG: hypothetical protein COC09_08750 [Gammaproteobacteria bacterium]|nr:VWA domain-containing protein [Gammaproteobacteria bacterium]PCH62393.1 MAG: hypothetical protein COC09_08750 [Gammaproteobacteria bacterium]